MSEITVTNTSLMNQSLQNNHSFKKTIEINNATTFTNKQSENEINKIKQSRSAKTFKSSNDLINKIPFYPASTHMSKNLKKSIAENNISTHENEKEKTTLYSTWTPLNDEKYNQKVYFLIIY
jgi:hypothetical protein